MKVTSKFDFKGFKILKANLSHVKDKQITSFTIFAQKANYNEENHIFEIISEITFNYDDETNACLFSAGYLINDLEWLEIMAEQTVINEMFRIVFPYIRTKIQEFTSDLRPGFMLPIIEFSNLDVTRKIVFNLNKVENLTN